MDNIEIREMTDVDFNKISPVLQIDFDEFWTPEILQGELNNTNSKYYVLIYNQEIAGFGGLWFSVDDVHLTNIVIKKTYRNKGFGNALLQKLILNAKNSKKKSLTLEVNENNTNAKKLYLKNGFKILGIRKKYYNNNDNALIMTLYFN